MVRNVLKVPQGEWLLQTAAGSALGKIVIQLGRAYGFRTINVIRNAEQAQELKQLGGDVVIVAGQDLKQEVLAQTRGKGFRYALDAVGGELGNAVIDALAPRGHLLIIGDLGEGNLKLDVKNILFKTLRIEGFWLSEWVRRNPFKIPGLYFRLVRLLSSQKLVMPECRTFPLEEVVAAVEFAESPLKGSKVLLESRT
jgi:NADPH:quinone reductase-like Zn-dependent oxidoreductase